MNKEMLKGTIDLLILSILNEMDSYGYEISKAIKARTEGAFEIQEATLYLSLKRLEKQKAISAYWGEESHGGRRKYYAITEEGKTLLRKFIEDWRHMSSIVERFI
ncbi:PadR family transcriptional regulator [Anoxybacteroides tepidamans]|uniref:PadR family transcriptional regulator n=1 Tax=Anoxybacteroides tepidamans TaxID=265948 RepID=UPI00047F5D01|nr:helix-turn-helix transcriptional regulator [Anoxybacillus tepidamans]